MIKPKALIMVTPGFAANENDTTCLPYLQTLLKAIQQTDSSLKLVVLTLQYPFSAKIYQWNTIEIIAFGGRNKNKIRQVTIFFKVLYCLWALKKQYKIIGLLSFWLDKSAFFASIFAKINRIKSYYWLLGQDAKKGNKFVNWIKPKSGSLIAISDFIAREFHKNYQILPEYRIPIGVDVSLFSTNLQEKDIDVLGVGSLIPLKQFDIFLTVTKQLISTFPNLKAVICGDGPEIKKLKLLSNELELNEHITFCGELPHQDALKLMRRAKLLLHPSNYEGLGLVNLEALYAGAMVISFVKPMEKVIENWFHVGNIEEMIATAKRCLSQPEDYKKNVLPYKIADSAAAVLKLYN